MEASPRKILLTIPNDHVGTDGGTNFPPEFDLTADYVAYAPNMFGEQMVFVQRKGEATATLYHGDCAWEPVAIRDGIPVGLVAHQGEMLFIAACWIESATLRPDDGTRQDSAIIQALRGIGGTIQRLTMLESLVSPATDSE